MISFDKEEQLPVQSLLSKVDPVIRRLIISKNKL